MVLVGLMGLVGELVGVDGMVEVDRMVGVEKLIGVDRMVGGEKLVGVGRMVGMDKVGFEQLELGKWEVVWLVG